MQDNELLKIEGSVEDITFRNEENGWTVLEVMSEDAVFTAVGEMAQASVGEQVVLLGNWANHNVFGRQFKFTHCEQKMPHSVSAILKYLSAGGIKGVGPATAEKLVKAFGEDTLNVIENDPIRLTQIRGMSAAKAMRIKEDYDKQFGMREAMLKLEQLGLTSSEAMRAFKKWGVLTVDRVKLNPYLLASEGIYISFMRADQIAKAQGFENDNSLRIRAGIDYVLRHNINNGHSCLPTDKVIPATTSFLETETDAVGVVLDQMLKENTLVEVLIGGTNYLFLPKLYAAEKYCAGRVSLMTGTDYPLGGNIENEINQLEETLKISYEEKQKKAISEGLTRGIFILTGGPGTGKTTTLNGIITLLEKHGKKVSIAAPTGRAAKRIAEITGKEAKTIHRLLEVEFKSDSNQAFARNEQNPLDCDVVIVDEFSMVDIIMFSNLLKALRLSTRLVIVGDFDQLPPIGPGNPLRDMIESEIVPCVKLTEIFRQAKESQIIVNAHKIVSGEHPDLGVKDNDFFFMKFLNPMVIAKKVEELYCERLKNAYGYNPLTDIQILCPSRKGELGVENINKRIQDKINPFNNDEKQNGKRQIKIGDRVFRTGDKVMQNKNDYDIMWTKDDGTDGTGIFNGDIGLLEEIDKSLNGIMVRFDDRVAYYSMDEAQNLELAYAVTVHKSQGNEFDVVVMPMFNGPPQLYYRNLLYTAVTRAKKLIVMVGNENVVYQMVDNCKKTLRYSAFKTFLEEDERITEEQIEDEGEAKL